MSYTEPDLMSPAEEQSVIRILNVTLGLALPGCLRVAAELNIADHLADDPLSVTILAERTGSDPDNLRRILRMLALNGIFTGTDDDGYRLSPDAEFLRRDHPCSQRDAVLTLTDNTYWSTIGQLNESVRGKLNFKKLFGKTFYEYQATKPNRDDSYNFPSGMSALSEMENYFVTRAYDFPSSCHIADIGGGEGSLLLRILRSDPTLTATLFDSPHVVSDKYLSQLGDDSRWSLDGGDFFKSVPQADMYLLKKVIFNQDDANALAVLKNCRNAMKPDSKLLIIESVVHPETNPAAHYGMGILCMAILPGGGERTIPEFKALLAEAGLKINRLIPTECYISVLEVVAA
ncbi:TPA: methyltransferase [Morganella morganii]|nr:methyltransferase [Morganella morganii]